MLSVTVAALASFPQLLEDQIRAVPAGYLDWRPPSWDGIPSEPFTALQQLCHVRDIEIEGYHVRLRRMLDEDSPELASIDSVALVGPRRYAEADPDAVLAEIRHARRHTIALIAGLGDAELGRPGSFEGYGRLTLKALIHYLCSHDLQHLSGIQWLLGQIDSEPLAARG
jgi:hypothetical protein